MWGTVELGQHTGKSTGYACGTVELGQPTGKSTGCGGHCRATLATVITTKCGTCYYSRKPLTLHHTCCIVNIINIYTTQICHYSSWTLNVAVLYTLCITQVNQGVLEYASFLREPQLSTQPRRHIEKLKEVYRYVKQVSNQRKMSQSKDCFSSCIEISKAIVFC